MISYDWHSVAGFKLPQQLWSSIPQTTCLKSTSLVSALHPSTMTRRPLKPNQMAKSQQNNRSDNFVQTVALRSCTLSFSICFLVRMPRLKGPESFVPFCGIDPLDAMMVLEKGIWALHLALPAPDLDLLRQYDNPILSYTSHNSYIHIYIYISFVSLSESPWPPPHFTRRWPLLVVGQILARHSALLFFFFFLGGVDPKA